MPTPGQDQGEHPGFAPFAGLVIPQSADEAKVDLTHFARRGFDPQRDGGRLLTADGAHQTIDRRGTGPKRLGMLPLQQPPDRHRVLSLVQQRGDFGAVGLDTRFIRVPLGTVRAQGLLAQGVPRGQVGQLAAQQALRLGPVVVFRHGVRADVQGPHDRISAFSGAPPPEQFM